MIAAERVDLAVRQAAPQGDPVGRGAQRWLADILGPVRLSIPLVREVKVERTGLDAELHAARPPAPHLLQRGGAGEVDDVGGSAGHLREGNGPGRRARLGLARPR